MSRQSHESAYQFMLDNIEEFGNQVFLSTYCNLANGPQASPIVLSRHKAVARILSGYEDVLEVGCGDGFLVASPPCSFITYIY